MARTRSVKPEAFLDETLGDDSFPVEAHFLRLGLPCLADKSGRLEDRPVRIAAQIFPYRRKVDVEKLLTRLERAGSIVRYTVKGTRLIQILGWEEDQNPHPNEAKSRLPGPELKDDGNATPSNDMVGAHCDITPPMSSGLITLVSDHGSLISGHEPVRASSHVVSGPTPGDLQRIWNTFAEQHDLQRWKGMGEKRQRLARLSLEACPDLAKWEAWIAHQMGNPYMLGENDRGWKADVDWLLKVENRDKVADFDPDVAARIMPRRPRPEDDEQRNIQELFDGTPPEDRS